MVLSKVNSGQRVSFDVSRAHQYESKQSNLLKNNAHQAWHDILLFSNTPGLCGQ